MSIIWCFDWLFYNRGASQANLWVKKCLVRKNNGYY